MGCINLLGLWAVGWYTSGLFGLYGFGFGNCSSVGCICIWWGIVLIKAAQIRATLLKLRV